jgi:mannose-6-phosphate isomerase-like protein (cupin superfamily)
MDKFSKQIWKEILPAEKEVVPAVRKRKPAKDEPPSMDHWTPPILLERAAYLRKLAKFSDGSASETLHEYPQHHTMLSFRSRDGVVEQHADFADVFYVLDGRAALVTGGNIVGAHTIAPGEVRGASIDGGTRQELRAGDVAHVPAGLPHQMLVAADRALTCFVIKVRESK